MVAVVDDIDLLGDGVVGRDDVLAVIFGLLGCVENALHLSHRFEQKYLQIIAIRWKQVDAIPEKGLQVGRNRGMDAAGQIAVVGEHFEFLLVVEY